MEPLFYRKGMSKDILRRIPNLAPRDNPTSFLRKAPIGWRRTGRRWWVNKSPGPGELGDISFEEWTKKVKPNRGYAIVSEGQFQLYIDEFKKVTVKRRD